MKSTASGITDFGGSIPVPQLHTRSKNDFSIQNIKSRYKCRAKIYDMNIKLLRARARNACAGG